MDNTVVLECSSQMDLPLLPLGLLSIFHPVSAPGKVEGGGLEGAFI